MLKRARFYRFTNLYAEEGAQTAKA